ncbi:MAG: NAD(P)-binding domain-containing protein [Leptospirales bacterium]|nr:NAD(P)-binding domain-containing protein [Leptospirales bacterium]
MATKVGVIGSGQVAQVLAAGFHRYGYQVMLGARQSAKAEDAAHKAGAGIAAGNFAETAAFAQIVVLAVKGTAAEDAVRLIGAEQLAGKTVIDVSNPISDLPPVNGVLQFFTGPNESLMERLQKLAPAANFVKAFSCVGNAYMVDPKLPGGPPTMFLCGNSAAAKGEVIEALKKFGWDAADMGGVEAARAIEPLCILWCIPGFINNSWTHAFKLLRA